jgi:predicted glycoside hydrolase/deacetylase ChbG (UPF0249 family)
MTQRVVFNADDLGISRAANDGIAHAVASGLVREVSLSVTGPVPTEGVAAVRAAGADVGIGLHFTLTFGSALSGPLRGITDPQGRFVSLPRLLGACASGRVRREEVERELQAQLAALDALGISPTHLNGHHHVHLLPVVRDVVLDVLGSRPGLHVRVPLESARTSRAISLRRGVLSALSLDFMRRARRLPEFRRLPVVGLALGGEKHDFARAARRLSGEPVEWIVHPLATDPDADDGGGMLGATGSATELEALTSPEVRSLLVALRIVPSRYSDLR